MACRNPLQLKEELDDEEKVYAVHAHTTRGITANYSQDNTSDDEEYSRDSDTSQSADMQPNWSAWSPDWSSGSMSDPKRPGSSLCTAADLESQKPRASPATIDFCVVLDRDFQSIVVDRLSQQSRCALTDPGVANMPDNTRKKIQKEILHTVFDFLAEVLRATRPLNRRECRSLAASIRKYTGLVFEPYGLKGDNLAFAIQDGMRYRDKRIVNRDPIGRGNRRVKDMYLVNKRKFHLLASSEEMITELPSLDLIPEGYVEEDVHRILQAQIRERTGGLTAFAPVIGGYEALKKHFDWLIDGEVAHLVHENLRPELEKLELFLRERGHYERQDVHMELDQRSWHSIFASWDDDPNHLMQFVRILRAADIFWNPDQRPVLFLMDGEQLAGYEGSRILVRQEDDQILFDLLVDGGVLIGGLLSLEKAVASFLHISLVANMPYPKGSGMLCTVLQRRVAKLDEYGTQETGRNSLVSKEERAGRTFNKALDLYQRITATYTTSGKSWKNSEEADVGDSSSMDRTAFKQEHLAIIAAKTAALAAAPRPAPVEVAGASSILQRVLSSTKEIPKRRPDHNISSSQEVVGSAEEAVVVASKATAAKRMKGSQEAYLVNEAKFHTVVSEEELQQDLRLEGTDLGLEQTHRIIQHKIRSRITKLKTYLPVLTSYEALKRQFDWLMDEEEDVALRISQNLPQQLANIDLFLRNVGEEDVLEELDGMAGCGEQLQQMSILRAADIYWNPDRCPVLCSLQGDEMTGDNPRILAKPCGNQVMFDLAVEGEPFIVGLDSLEKAISSFIHVCFVANMQYPKGSGVLCTMLQRWVAKLDEYGTRAASSGDLVSEEDKADKRYKRALGDFSRKLFIIGAKKAASETGASSGS